MVFTQVGRRRVTAVSAVTSIRIKLLQFHVPVGEMQVVVTIVGGAACWAAATWWKSRLHYWQRKQQLCGKGGAVSCPWALSTYIFSALRPAAMYGAQVWSTTGPESKW